MKNTMLFLLVGFLFGAGCSTDFVNPNAATDEEVLVSDDGLMSFVNGLKSRYSLGGASTLYTSVATAGLATDELFVVNAGNAFLAALEAGGTSLTGDNSVISNLWESAGLINGDADKLLAAADQASDPGIASGVIAYASFFKALSIGERALFWEQVTTESLTLDQILAGEHVGFVGREAGLQEAVRLLEAALARIDQTPISARFNAQVGTAIDIENTLHALAARYSLFLGDYDNALQHACAVDLSSTSVFEFDAVSPNPIYRTSLVTNNVFEGNPSFGLEGALAPDPDDQRLDFFYNEENRVTGFYASDEAPIPVYRPGEMLLIKAEAYARQGQIEEAIEELNRVRTKTPAEDAFGLGAGLSVYDGPQTQEAVLFEIYRQRSIELYLSGLRLEDSRRFGRPGPTAPDPERNRNFYPYPNQERDNNPNTPSNPPI